MTKPRDLAGRRFGRLVAIEPDGPSLRMWRCACDCGSTALRTSRALTLDNVISCGCAHKESCSRNGRKNRTHGISAGHKNLYNIFKQMHRRCENPASPDHPRYGARGIKVCEEWGEPTAFAAWALAHGYATGMSIERDNNEVGYEPGNCRWIPAREQGRNTARVRWIEHNGRKLSASDWSRETGISVRTIIGRLNRGWAVSEALTRC